MSKEPTSYYGRNRYKHLHIKPETYAKLMAVKAEMMAESLAFVSLEDVLNRLLESRQAARTSEYA